ncbi:MAG: hypothetical protein ACRENX_11375 [Candidatus Dormibacteria bacterium]
MPQQWTRKESAESRCGLAELRLARDGVRLRCGAGDSTCPTLAAYREELGCVLYPHLRLRVEEEWPAPGLPLFALSSRWQRAFDNRDDPVHRPEGQRFGPSGSYIDGPFEAGLEELTRMVARSATDPQHPRRAASDAARFFERLLPGDPVALRCPRCHTLSLLGAESLRRQQARRADANLMRQRATRP